MAKRITTQELKHQIDQIQQNNTHIHDCIHRIENITKENRKYFEDRLDRLDSRIFWILGLVISTLATVIGSMIA